MHESPISPGEATILQAIASLQNDLAEVRHALGELQASSNGDHVSKRWYSTAEVAKLMHVTRHTVTVRWCASGRIDAEKDANGRYRIPAETVRQLLRGEGPDHHGN